MNSGESAMPTILSSRLRPLMIALSWSPGRKPWALAKDSLIVTSRVDSGSGSRPSRR